MALPWLIGAAVVGVIGAIAASGDDNKSSNSGGGNDDEERRRAERRAAEERAKAEREAKKQIFEQQFNARVQAAESQIAQGLEPYFALSFHGQTDSAQADNQDFFGTAIRGQEMHDLEKTVQNLRYVQELYEAEIKADTQLNRVLQEIENCESAIQAAKTLRNDIGETIKMHHS